MSLKAHSVIVQEVSDEVATAVDAVFRDGRLISATAVAGQILQNNPDCSMTVDELAVWIGRLAATGGIAVELGKRPWSSLDRSHNI